MTALTLSMPYSDIEKAGGLYCELRRRPPRSRRDLKNYVKVFLGVDVPDGKVCCDHNSPMDYLWHSYSTDLRLSSDDLQFQACNSQLKIANRQCNGDVIVWANRAGGKTELAAVATLWIASSSRAARSESWPARASRPAGCMNTCGDF